MRKIAIILLLLAGVCANAQTVVPAKPQKIYKKQDNKGILYFEESSFGALYKTNGWGFFYNKTKIIHATKKKFWEIEFNKTKHEKEVKTESLFTQGGPITPKNYYYGKINSLYTISYRKGYTKVLTEKSLRSGVEISLNTSYGVSLGLVKPYELMLIYGDQTTDNITFKTEKYSSLNASTFLDQNSIYSYAGTWQGFFDMKPMPGATARIGLAFDWATFDDNITTMEIGLNVDGYLLNVPLMAVAKNHQVFPAMYVSMRFGNRK